MTQIKKYDNLIVVTRQDISPGYQAVQSIHSTLAFVDEHPHLFTNWNNFSKAISLLAVKNEDELKTLIIKLTQKGIKHSVFAEPDIDHQITSIAIEPSESAFKACCSIPLALKQYNHHKLIYKHSNAERGLAV